MATGTQATDARKYHHDLVHYLVAPIVYTTLSKSLGRRPAGSLVIDAGVVVTTPFAGGTPQTIDLGPSSDTDGYATALVITAAGRKVADELATSDDLYSAVDVEEFATLSAGATPSAGAGYAYVAYIIADRTP